MKFLMPALLTLLVCCIILLLSGCVTAKGSGRWCLACAEITVEGETQPIELPKER